MLRVAFVTANPPSPIPEGSEEEYSPEASEREKGKHKRCFSELLDLVSASFCCCHLFRKLGVHFHPHSLNTTLNLTCTF